MLHSDSQPHQKPEGEQFGDPHISTAGACREGAQFAHRAEFVHELYHPCFPVMRQVRGYGEHMVHYHVAFPFVQREQLHRVEERYLRVTYPMPALAVNALVLLTVVEEQVVQKPGSRGGTRVPVQLPAYQEVVVGHVKAVLKPSSSLVVLVFAELLYRVAVQQIADAAIIIRQVVYGFMGKNRFVQIITLIVEMNNTEVTFLVVLYYNPVQKSMIYAHFCCFCIKYFCRFVQNVLCYKAQLAELGGFVHIYSVFGRNIFHSPEIP